MSRWSRYPLVALLPLVDEHDTALGCSEPIYLSVPAFATWRFGERWTLKVQLLSWHRKRGEYPHDWKRRPVFPGPILRFWILGPFCIYDHGPHHWRATPEGDA